MDDDKFDALHWPLAPWFPPWTHIILIVNGAIFVALLAARAWAARRGDTARTRLYQRLLNGSVLLTVGGNLVWLLTFVAPTSILVSDVGMLFTLGSVVPLLVWAVPLVVLVELLLRGARPR